MGALLTVAVTLIVGAAVFSYVNGEAGVQENRYGAAVAGTVNQLNEKFVVADMAFENLGQSGCTNSCVSFYIYNNGQIGLQLKQVLLYDSIQTQMHYDCNSNLSCTAGAGTTCTSAASISPAIGSSMTPIAVQGNPVQFTITLSGCSFTSGTTYYLNILGVNGDDVIYYSVR